MSPINVENTLNKLDLLMKIARTLRSDAPWWLGVMEAVSIGSHAGQATVRFLSMIDLHPTNMTCIYSSICFISRECERHNCTPVITYLRPTFMVESKHKSWQAWWQQTEASHRGLRWLSCQDELLGLHRMLDDEFRSSRRFGNDIWWQCRYSFFFEWKIVCSSRGHIRVESMFTRLLNRKTYATPPPTSKRRRYCQPWSSNVIGFIWSNDGQAHRANSNLEQRHMGNVNTWNINTILTWNTSFHQPFIPNTCLVNVILTWWFFENKHFTESFI